MNGPTISLELPRQLYIRLEALAENEQVDPVTLTETWLDAAVEITVRQQPITSL